MGLFDKKNCDICGGKIGLLGNRKLDDGNLCKDCAAKLSPWFSERRSSTVEQIKEQLAYREQNKANLENFQVTRQYDFNYDVLIDDTNKNFLVTSNSNWKNANPDIISFDMLTGCSTDIEETKTEVTFEDKEGHSQSYNPKRYSYDYYFKIKLFIKHPYFDEISFRINSSSVEEEDHPGPMGRPGMAGPQRTFDQAAKQGIVQGVAGALGVQPGIGMGGHSDEYYRWESKLNEAKAVFNEIMNNARGEAQAAFEKANAPKVKVTCPHCGAVTLPDDNGLCEFCGLPVK